jgi:hypothetical protein
MTIAELSEEMAIDVGDVAVIATALGEQLKLKARYAGRAAGVRLI